MNIRNIFKNLLKNKKVLIISAGVVVLLFIVVLIITIKSYSISDKVKISADAVPANIKYYIEIKNPADFLENLKKRPYGRAVLESDAWKKVAAAEQVKRFSSLLYLIEMRGGVLLKQDEVASFFDGSAGYGIMPDGSFLAVARTGIKSKLGLALVTSLKGEKIEAKQEPAKGPKEKKKSGDGDGNRVTADSFKSQYEEERLEIGNVNIYALKISGNTTYMTMLGNYLFVSDSLDTLKLSLETATKAQNSITSLNGGSGLSDSYDDEDILVYAGKENGIFSAFSPVFIKGKAIAGIIRLKDSISMDIYNLGFGVKDKEGNSGESADKDKAFINFDSMIPKDCTVSMFVYDKTFADIAELIPESGIPGDIKNEYEDLFRGSGLSTISYKSKGSAFVLRKLALKHGKLIPEFMFAFGSSNGDTVARSLFKTVKGTGRSYQNKRFSLYSVSAEESFYSPAVLNENGASFVFSTSQNARDVISCLNRNNPVVSDSNSYSLLESFSAPCRIVVNIPALLEDIKSFYYYGADKSGDYSRKTIDADVIPLFYFLNDYSELNIAFGNDGFINGRAVISRR